MERGLTCSQVPARGEKWVLPLGCAFRSKAAKVWWHFVLAAWAVESMGASMKEGAQDHADRSVWILMASRVCEQAFVILPEERNVA